MRGRWWRNRYIGPQRFWREVPITATERPGRTLTGAGALFLAALVATTAGALTQRQRLERLNLEESALAAQQDRNISQLARLLSVLERLRRNPPPALLVSPADARDAVRAAIMVKAMTPELQARAKRYAVEAAEIARQRRLTAVESEAMFSAESARAEGLRGLATGDDGLTTAQADVSSLDLDKAGPPKILLAPSPGRVIAHFGSPLTGGGRARGLTILTAQGAAVRSPAEGRVQYVGPVKGWGVIMILRLAGGYHLVLGGLERTSVEAGQSVAAGSPVGWMPAERQAASELYFEVREKGAPVDPLRWMKTQAG